MLYHALFCGERGYLGIWLEVVLEVMEHRDVVTFMMMERSRLTLVKG